MRSVKNIHRHQPSHWVGNGFYVTSLFSHMGKRHQTSPFLMLDYAAPKYFEPNTTAPRGVGAHPHRGFETVTIAYHGEVAHRDGSGAAGVIEAGDVQWMTAGRGTVHEEFHSPAFSQRGGLFEMIQLWVNLPRARKGVAPRYQHLKGSTMPVLPVDGGQLRLIAGEYQGVKGAAETHTELNIWDVSVNVGETLRLTLPESHHLSLAIRRGTIQFNQDAGLIAEMKDWVEFEHEHGEVVLSNVGHDVAELLLMSGEPIHEPIAAYGPFVMNTPEEIRESIELFRAGEMGALH